MKSKSAKVAKYMFKTGVEVLQTQPSPNGIEPLTVYDKLSKKINIRVEIKNLHDPNKSANLKDCQLVVYLNDKIKYVSKKGAIEAYSYEKFEADWKTWHFVNHRKVMYGGIQFRSPQDRKHFYNFCSLCRACYRIDAAFENVRRDYVVKISA